jgi:hypothetical protein
MKMLLAALLATVVLAAPARADSLSYDDPGMHYRAPDGWQRISLGDAPPDPDGGVVAVFTSRANKNSPRSVTISIAPFDGSLSDFSSKHLGDLRESAGDNGAVLVDHNEKTKLANGMPAVYLVYTFSSNTTPAVKTYEYLIIDGQRSIDVKYSGYASDVGDADATATLSSLYAVAYPGHAPGSQ